MLVPALTVRRCLPLGLRLASLVVPPGSVAGTEFQNAKSDLAFALSGTASDRVR